MRTYFLIVIACLFSGVSQAQYTMAGKIEYERKSNVHQQLDDMMSDDKEDGGDNSWVSMVKQKMPKFMSNYFDLSFNPENTLYKPGREVENPFKMFGQSPASDNTVYTDLKAMKVTASKKVFEQKYLVQDSLRELTWKIGDEIRTVANFKCRKAVGKYCDSVYVVAFYTEDIPVSGGPEMFAGLPGMILQVAIPRLHTTWTATKVELIVPKPEDMKAPDKGKKVTQQEIYTEVIGSVKKWGSFAHRSIWWTML